MGRSGKGAAVVSLLGSVHGCSRACRCSKSVFFFISFSMDRGE